MSNKAKPSALALPDNLVKLMAAAEARNNLPPGSMAAVMSKEVGGQEAKFLNDPAAYHYGLNAQGRRVAGHNGKISTAFGPFGLLESTAAKPGYGVKPLANKSIEEQVRFAADYLAARTKQAGSLAGGLAGYGEGAKYGNAVAAKLGVAPVPVPMNAQPGVVDGVGRRSIGRLPDNPVQLSDMQIAQATTTPIPTPVPLIQEAGLDTLPVGPTQADAWQEFLRAMPREAQPVNVAEMDYGKPMMAMPTPQFQYRPMDPTQVNFNPFSAWKGRA